MLKLIFLDIVYAEICIVKKYFSSITQSEALKVVKKDKTPFLTEEEEEELRKTDDKTEQQKQVEIKLPSELTCPFDQNGKHLIKDAVIVPCCGHFICCDECIRERILHDEIVECPMNDCGQEIDTIESITPYHPMRKMINDYLNDIKLSNNRVVKSSKTDDAFIDFLLNDENTKSSMADTDGESKADGKQSPIVKEKSTENLALEIKVAAHQQESDSATLAASEENETPAEVEAQSKSLPVIIAGKVVASQQQPRQPPTHMMMNVKRRYPMPYPQQAPYTPNSGPNMSIMTPSDMHAQHTLLPRQPQHMQTPGMYYPYANMISTTYAGYAPTSNVLNPYFMHHPMHHQRPYHLQQPQAIRMPQVHMVQPIVNPKLHLPPTLSEKEFYEYKEKLKKE